MASIDGRPVEAVLFDYGDTLVSFRRPDAAIHRAYAEIAGLLANEGFGEHEAAMLVEAIHDRVDAEVDRHGRSRQLEEVDIVALERHAWKELGLALDDRLLDRVANLAQEAWWEGISVGADVASTLQTLRDGGLRLGLVSNAAYRGAHLRAGLEHLGLAGRFDVSVFSSEARWRKPSARIFEQALQELQVPAAAALMVGDRLHEDIGGAEAAGMLGGVLICEHRDDRSQREGESHHVQPLAVIDRISALPSLLGWHTATQDRRYNGR